MSSEVEIHLTAVDDASAIIEEAAGNVQAANAQITDSTTAASDATQQAGVSTQQTALGFNNLAMSGMSLYMAIDRVENSQVALDRAHLNVEKATNAVTAAQTHYNDAVAKYGPNSKEAQDALAKLHTAQDGLQVAQERADMAQRNYNNTLAFSAMTVIPSLITAFTSVMTVAPAMSGAIDAIGGAMDFLAANPIVLVIAGIAALVMGLIYAYNNCGPFRDVINEIASVISGAFSWALKHIQEILIVLLGPIGLVIDAIIHWQDIANALRDALGWLWNNILKPIADFLEKVFITVINDVMAAIKPLIDALNAVSGAAHAVSGAMSTAANAVTGGLSSAGGAIAGFIGSICFAHALQKAADDSKVTMDNWANMVGSSMDRGLTMIKDFNKQAEISGVGAMAAGGGAITGAGGVVAPTHVSVTISAPLVQVQGSADKETAQLAAKIVQDKLKNVLVEATSKGALETHKRIRIGWQG